ncbi:MAG TPA: AfsR/SARP family transcriptional regulator, partial [Phytomonospora sp.]
MPVRLIGPVVITAAEPVPVTAAKRACVLAVLAARPGVPVSRADLVDRGGDGVPPETVTSVLYSYITRLRADLKGAGATIRRAGSHGYLRDSDAETVDVHRIRALAARAGETGSLELWREVCEAAKGEVLAGLTGRWAQEFRDGFAHERRGWLDARYAAELAAGNHALVAEELTARAAVEALSEPLVAHLMLALDRCGRPAEALRRFEATRLRLRDGLGADPSPALRDLHVRILGQDPGLLGVGEGAGRVPAMLPAGIASFTGRTGQLAALSAFAGQSAPVLLTGHAGAGKTALAVHWGQSNVDAFPDGALYVNLRGFGGGDPVTPRDALGRLLLALGVAADAVPREADAAAELFRTRTGGRRMLVVLDNAGNAEQVRPLLPGAGCLAVVTSRDKLPGLVAVDDARVVNVDVLPREDAMLLLRHLLGDSPDDAALDDLAGLCGDLPLALRIAAANVAGAFNGRIDAYVRELARDRLAFLAVDGDPDAAVTVALDHSHADLDTATRRLYARLGAVPVDNAGEDLVLAVSGLEPEAARRSLRRLAARHLVEQYEPGRYRMHDLVRIHAAARARSDLTEAERTEAVEAFIGVMEGDRHAENLDDELNVFAAITALDGHPRLWRLTRR